MGICYGNAEWFVVSTDFTPKACTNWGTDANWEAEGWVKAGADKWYYPASDIVEPNGGIYWRIYCANTGVGWCYHWSAVRPEDALRDVGFCKFSGGKNEGYVKKVTYNSSIMWNFNPYTPKDWYRYCWRGKDTAGTWRPPNQNKKFKQEYYKPGEATVVTFADDAPAWDGLPL